MFISADIVGFAAVPESERDDLTILRSCNPAPSSLTRSIRSCQPTIPFATNGFDEGVLIGTGDRSKVTLQPVVAHCRGSSKSLMERNVRLNKLVVVSIATP